jgi:hypothetical protein
MRRGVVALVVTLSFGLVPAARAQSVTVPPTQERTSTSHVSGYVRKIVVDSNSGDVTVRPGTGTTVTHTDHWFYDKPAVKITLSNGILTVTSRCPNAPLNNCWTEIAASVARTAAVQVTSSLGYVHVGAMHAASVIAQTSNGDILLSGVQSKTVKATTANGAVKAALTSAPDSAALRTANGDVSAFVPRGAYALDVRDSYGDVTVTGVRNSRTSPHKLSARTSNGDIKIEGR